MLKSLLSALSLSVMKLVGVGLFNSKHTKEQLQVIITSASDQVVKKAEETSKAMKKRMAVMEVEYQLNRLYPQIGKLTCDLMKSNQLHEGSPEFFDKIKQVEEYRNCLEEMAATDSDEQRESQMKQSQTM